jgi:hypothetical protein
VYSKKTPDDGQRNYPKHVEFYPKNKSEKLVHLVGFIIRIYHDARSPERQEFTELQKIVCSMTVALHKNLLFYHADPIWKMIIFSEPMATLLQLFI